MTGIDSRPADTEGEEAQRKGHVPAASPYHCIEECTQAVSGVEGGHSSKDVGIARIDTMKDWTAYKGIKTCQTRLTAHLLSQQGRVEHHTTLLGIKPGRRSGMDVVTGKAQEIDEEESPGKAKE